MADLSIIGQGSRRIKREANQLKSGGSNAPPKVIQFLVAIAIYYSGLGALLIGAAVKLNPFQNDPLFTALAPLVAGVLIAVFVLGGTTVGAKWNWLIVLAGMITALGTVLMYDALTLLAPSGFGVPGH